ncbi:unnamed protein product [Pedinophyceae sp. YPF-701]|nr:unnamed protein product [Pedinophyceae sp. YPF-701]
MLARVSRGLRAAAAPQLRAFSSVPSKDIKEGDIVEDAMSHAKPNRLDVILRGDALEAYVLHSRTVGGYTYVGEDELGNKYYEKPEEQWSRHRIVLYKDSNGYDATHVPVPWHAWLHHMRDLPPTKDDYTQPAYGIAKLPYDPAEPYVQKGNWHHEGNRTWRKRSSWKPPK